MYQALYVRARTVNALTIWRNLDRVHGGGSPVVRADEQLTFFRSQFRNYGHAMMIMMMIMMMMMMMIL